MSQVDDVKLRLILTIIEDDAAVNVSTCTIKNIILKSPSGVKTTHTASFLTDGSEGKIYYDTASGDIDEAGTWKLQGYVEIASGAYYTTIESFRVNCNL